MAISDLLTRATDSNTGRPVIAKLAAPKTIGAASITLSVSTNWTVVTPIYIAVYNLTSTGVKDASTQTDWKGILSGTTVSNMTLTGGVDRAYGIDAFVEITYTSRWAKDQYDWAAVHSNPDGTLLPSAVQTAIGNAGILASNLAAGSVTTTAIADGTVTYTDLLATIFSGQMQSYTPAVASTTGTNAVGQPSNYVNLGGIKLVWGTVALSAMNATTGHVTNVSFPASFFTLPPKVVLSIAAESGATNQHVSGDGRTAGAFSFYFDGGVNTGGNEVDFIAVGM